MGLYGHLWRGHGKFKTDTAYGVDYERIVNALCCLSLRQHR